MPSSLIDTNVWLAAVLPTHPAHQSARSFLQTASAGEPALFCRSTQQSFLRLLTTPSLLQKYGATSLTNRLALRTLTALLQAPGIAERAEPVATPALWHSIAALDTASPKVWMDAYLAAFAIAGGSRLVTLDKDFKSLEKHGLQLQLLAV